MVFEEFAGVAVIFIFLLIILASLIYFIPTFVSKGKQNRPGIFLVNLLLGWTLLGWILALVWAITSPIKPGGTDARGARATPTQDPAQAPTDDAAAKIEKLSQLHKKGHITTKELQEKKKKLLDEL